MMAAREARRSVPAGRRAIALVRVSMESDKLTSPEIQRHAIQQHSDRRGDEIVEWIEGIDESGSRKKSAWWAKLDYAVERVERGEVDVIYVWKFSRTARQRLKWALALDRVDSAGGSIESATEQTDPTPSGRFTRGMIGEMNAYQAELIGEVWRETHERRRRNGVPPTGGPRFGYQRVDGRYEPDPVTGPILADLYRWYLSGMGSAQLTRKLNELGVEDRRWTYQGVMGLLDSGFAAGLLGRTRPKLLPAWEREYTEGIHPPLIDMETWHAYVARRQQRYRKQTRTPRRYLLTGLVRCGDCGSPMSGKVFDGRPTYVCSRSTTTDLVKRVTMVAWRVEKLVDEWLAVSADKYARAQAVEATRRKSTRTQTVANSIRRDIEKQNDRLVRLSDLLIDKIMTAEEYRIKADEIQARKDALERRLSLAVVNPVQAAAPADLPDEIMQLWPTMTVEQKAGTLRPLIDRIVIYPAARRGAVDRHVKIIGTWE
ncbi:recombinase family protein [Microbacterium hominis]|uniref:Recombinase domain-containing protein n=1 Tax=Microbacterium hominis TaxID=162426 RepID=A0A2K9D545_9MICO|nr:recombinase family protein [Microbacterium hominis]AUG28795.1 hypothetical protein CXR34_04435 [Microbacterium hominis]